MTSSLLALAPSALAAADAPAIPAGRLVPAALIGIAVIVLLITRFKVHPFLGLTIGSLAVAAVAGVPMTDAVDSFTKGFGSTAAGVGTLIALGAMFGKLLADSGGADEIVDTIVGRSSSRTLPWAMARVGALIGLPMFFEIGLVLLMPVIFLVARRSGLSLIRVGIPALAGLSAMHGLVPPHPGPLVAIDALKANLGLTLGLGVLVAIPTVAHRRPAVRASSPTAGSSLPAPERARTRSRGDARLLRPGFGVTVADRAAARGPDAGQGARRHLRRPRARPCGRSFDFLGTPLIALLIAVIVGDVHPRPRCRHGPARDHRGRSSSRCRRSPASCSSSPPVAASSRP